MRSSRPELVRPAVAIVVAAGSGSRLGAAVPKALIELGGRPLVAHAVDALAAGGVDEAVVVLPPGAEAAFSAALVGAAVPVRFVTGGAERQDSVRLGLDSVRTDSLVLVHDAARPLVPAAVIAALIDTLRAGAEAVVPALPVTDSVRQVVDGGSRAVDRSSLRFVQTPQGFAGEVLRDAHDRALAAGLRVTDDASACEAAGYRVALIPGSVEALKITTRADLLVAEAMLAARGES